MMCVPKVTDPIRGRTKSNSLGFKLSTNLIVNLTYYGYIVPSRLTGEEKRYVEKFSMSKRPASCLPSLIIPEVMTLKTLADVRKLIGHIPKERRELSTWQHVEKTLRECAPATIQ